MLGPCGVVTIVAKPGCEDELVELMATMATVARHDDGCEIYSVHRTDRDPRVLFVYERYRDAAALELHRRNTALRDLGGRLLDLTESVDVTMGALIAGAT